MNRTIADIDREAEHALSDLAERHATKRISRREYQTEHARLQSQYGDLRRAAVALAARP